MAEKNIETDESHHYRDTISHDLTYSALTQLPIKRLHATLSERATLAGSVPTVAAKDAWSKTLTASISPAANSAAHGEEPVGHT